MCAIAVIGPLAVAVSANAPQIAMAFEQAVYQSAWQPTSSNDAYMMMAGNIAGLKNPALEAETISVEVQSVARNSENGQVFLRALERGVTNPKNYWLYDKDAGSGLSTFKSPPVTGEDVFSVLPGGIQRLHLKSQRQQKTGKLSRKQL